MATIQPNFNLRPAQVQAERLKNLPDKSAYNEFVDSVLGSKAFVDSASADAKALAVMARNVAESVPGKDARFQLLQGAFDSALNGSLASAPGGPAAVMAKMVLDLLPNVHESRRDDVMTRTLASISYRSGNDEAQAHADFALDAGDKAKTAKTSILLNGLGVIADLGETGTARDSQTEQAISDFRKGYQELNCKTFEGFPNAPRSMDGKGVIILTRDPQSGELRQTSGAVKPVGPDSNTAMFRVGDSTLGFNSNEVLATIELPFGVRCDSPDQALSDLRANKEYKDAQVAFWEPYAAKGFHVGSNYSGVEMNQRQVAFLYREEDGTKKEYQGTISATDRLRSARFQLSGREGEMNSNNIMAVAFVDGMRAPY